METWYRTGGCGKDLIEAVTVVKSTEKTVIIRDKNWNGLEHYSRYAIKSDWKCYFRAWEEAHAHLIASAEAKVTSARLALEKSTGHLGNVRGLQKPA